MKIVEVDPDGLLEDRVEILRINYNFLIQQYCRSLKLFLVTIILVFTTIRNIRLLQLKEQMNIIMQHYNIIIQWGGGRRGGGGAGTVWHV